MNAPSCSQVPPLSRGQAPRFRGGRLHAFAGAGSTLSRGQAPRFRGGRLPSFAEAGSRRSRGDLKLQPHAQGIGGVCLFTACRWIGFVIEVGAQGRIYTIAEGKTNSGT